MRRVFSPAYSVLALAGLTSGLIATSLAVGTAPASAAAGEKVCTITDDRLTELSGILALKSGYVVINDSTDDPSRELVFFLNKECKVSKEVRYGGNGPRDPEDLALSADGKTIWIADIGANITSTNRRTTVALWSMPVDGSARPVLHRLVYPDNKTPNAEALLIGPDDVPLIITKNVGTAEIWRPSGALQPGDTEGVPLTKVGEITLPQTTTANLLGKIGRTTITGAARSADGSRVVLRTYADAFEWDVVDGDLVKTLTTEKPRATALADPFGEAITYSADGRRFETVSDLGELDTEEKVSILRYTPSTKAAKAATADNSDQREAERSWLDDLDLDDITYLITAVGVLGALLVGAGIFGIVWSRRAAARKADATGGVGERSSGRSAVSAPGHPESSGFGGGDRDSGAVYGRGAGRSEPARPAGYDAAPVAGGPSGRGRRSAGAVYGAAPASGTTYGSGAATTYGSGGSNVRRAQGGVYGGGRGSGNVYGSGGGYRPEENHPDGPDRTNAHGGRHSGPEYPGPTDYDYR